MNKVAQGFNTAAQDSNLGPHAFYINSQPGLQHHFPGELISDHGIRTRGGYATEKFHKCINDYKQLHSQYTEPR